MDISDPIFLVLMLHLNLVIFQILYLYRTLYPSYSLVLFLIIACSCTSLFLLLALMRPMGNIG